MNDHAGDPSGRRIGARELNRRIEEIYRRNFATAPSLGLKRAEKASIEHHPPRRDQ